MCFGCGAVLGHVEGGTRKQLLVNSTASNLHHHHQFRVEPWPPPPSAVAPPITTAVQHCHPEHIGSNNVATNTNLQLHPRLKLMPTLLTTYVYCPYNHPHRMCPYTLTTSYHMERWCMVRLLSCITCREGDQETS